MGLYSTLWNHSQDGLSSCFLHKWPVWQVEAQTGSRQLTPPLQDQGRAVRAQSTLLPPRLTPAERAPHSAHSSVDRPHMSTLFNLKLDSLPHGTAQSPWPALTTGQEVGRHPGLPAASNGRSLGITDLYTARHCDVESGFVLLPSSVLYLRIPFPTWTRWTVQGNEEESQCVL